MPDYQSYYAVIRDPNKAQPVPDSYGTLTIPGAQSTFGPSPVPLRKWAAALLAECSTGAYCDIYRMEQVWVERVAQAEQPCSEAPLKL